MRARKSGVNDEMETPDAVDTSAAEAVGSVSTAMAARTPIPVKRLMGRTPWF